jgi:uncharacterized protein YheU (UPF0270 family)
MDFIDDGNSPENEKKPPMAIELERLTPEVIDAVIEAFILREGTDYGVVEISLEKKKEQVLKQLHKKDLHIVYDFNTDSVTVMTDQDWKKLTK